MFLIPMEILKIAIPLFSSGVQLASPALPRIIFQ
ncbi:Uncharacterised protein [Klebsiella pneumoniae]|nr:Uncharacterised protein [Klebsiella pneumoniae]